MPPALKKLLANKLFYATTVVPTLAALLYFGLIASDEYTSESRFVVRSPDGQAPTPFGQMLKSAGFAKAQDDSYIVQDFILSRDAMVKLDEQLGIKGRYGASTVDLFSRFAGIDPDNSYEALHRFYRRKVTVQLDPASSIVTLSTAAFGGGTAFEMNRKLLEMSEALVNELNKRGRADLLAGAEREVQLAREKYRESSVALASFRSANQLIDPERQATIQLTQVSRLGDELIASKSLIARLESQAKESPQLPALRQQAKLLEREINRLGTEVQGSGSGSMAAKSDKYQALQLDKEIAAKFLAASMGALDAARVEVSRKAIYLERVAQPSRPDVAMEPRRIRSIVVVFLMGLVAWGILGMLLSSVKEHSE